MTKAELRDHLKAGYFMDDAFDFSPGQDCDIFKADQFQAGDEIIYIPGPSSYMTGHLEDVGTALMRET